MLVDIKRPDCANPTMMGRCMPNNLLESLQVHLTTDVASNLATLPEVQTGNYFEKVLSTGNAMKATKDGFENKFIDFIESDEVVSKDLWFIMIGI